MHHPNLEHEENLQFFEFASDLEKQWMESKPRIANAELLRVFPEAKEILPVKIEEWEKERNYWLRAIRQRLFEITKLEETDQIVMRELIKIFLGTKLILTEGHIARLKRLKTISENRKLPKGSVTQSEIERAKQVPLQDVLDLNFRKSGNTLVALCPFHNERTGSFTVYLKSNSFYCYGCQNGGDIITLVKLLHGYNFIEAVRWLTK